MDVTDRPVTFGEELSAELHERRMKQAELARQLGVSNAAVSSWATDTSQPSPDNAMKLEEMLDVRPRGRWLRKLGYAAPEPTITGLITLEDHIRADDTISADDKRALLRFVAAARADAELSKLRDESG